MLVYTPIDIDLKLPPTEEMIDYCFFRHTGNPYNSVEGLAFPICLRNHNNNWNICYSHKTQRLTSIDKNLNADYEHYESAHMSSHFLTDKGEEELYFEPEFSKRFPQIENSIRKMPFKFINVAYMTLVGTHPSYTHKDPYDWPELGINQDVPNRYNILLNCHDTPVFYFTKDKDATEKKYLNLNPEFPIYAFDNENFWHGADEPSNLTKNRMQIIIVGVLDKDKHLQLVEQSKNKFKEQVVYWND
jgi:hypothetical protein